MSLKISMTVNGKSVSGDIEPRTLLVDFIRDTLRLTGTHIGCDTAQCGACTIHMHGKAVKSCNMLALQASGADIVQEPIEQPYGVRDCAVRDPAGNLIRIQQRR